MKSSVCIPMYNESRVIAKSAQELSDYMEAHFEDYEVIFCSDGSSDGCDEIVREMKLPNVNVICGDAGDQPLLTSEGLESADALVTLTGDDELNAIVSMYGSSCDLPLVITRLDRLDDKRIIDKLPIGTVVSPKKLFSNTVVRYVRAMNNQDGAAITIHAIAGGSTEALEFRIDRSTLHTGTPLKDIKLKKNVLIACITRRGKIEIPRGSSTFEDGDSVVVVSAGNNVIRQFNDVFE